MQYNLQELKTVKEIPDCGGKLYANAGITGYADYGKIISMVVTMYAQLSKGSRDETKHDQAVKVLELVGCCDVIKTPMTVLLYAEHVMEKCYHVYADRFGYVDHAKNTTMGVVQTDGVTSAALVADGVTLQMCEYASSVCQAGALKTAAPSNKRDSAEDLETSDSAETEACESSLKHDHDGDNVLATCGVVHLVIQVMLKDDFVRKRTDESTDVSDLHTFEFQCESDKLPSTLTEDTPLTEGCGMAAMGCAECGAAKAGDEAETAGSKLMVKMVAMGAETPCKSSDQGQVGDNTGMSSCGMKKEDAECGQASVKLGLTMLYIEPNGQAHASMKDEGGCYMVPTKGHCLQPHTCMMDAMGDTGSFEGAETATLGDNAVTDAKSTVLAVSEEKTCPVTCEGGCMAGVGMALKTTKQ